MTQQTISTAAVLKSLADETRLSIVRKLARDNNEVTSSDIISGCGAALSLSQPTISHHFQKLVAAGTISERKSGVEKFYTLNRSELESIGINVDKL